MSNPFIGEIRMFGGNFAPAGWAMCNGQTLAISQNTALFSLLGTTYGGNGTTNFQLPNMQGRVPIHMGQSAGTSPYVEGQSAGAETVVLTVGQLPPHTHAPMGSTRARSTSTPSGQFPSAGGYYDSASQVAMGQGAPTGGNQPHTNIQPYLTVNFIIALQGIYPSRN